MLGIAYDASRTYQTALLYFVFTGVASALLILGARLPRMAEPSRYLYNFQGGRELNPYRNWNLE